MVQVVQQEFKRPRRLVWLQQPRPQAWFSPFQTAGSFRLSFKEAQCQSAGRALEQLLGRSLGSGGRSCFRVIQTQQISNALHRQQARLIKQSCQEPSKTLCNHSLLFRMLNLLFAKPRLCAAQEVRAGFLGSA